MVQENFNILLFGLGILNLSLALILATKKASNFPPQKWLIAFFVAFAVDVFSEMIVFNKAITNIYPNLKYLPFRLILFYGACLFTYIEDVFAIKRHRFWYFRFAPTLFYFFLNTYYTLSASEPSPMINSIIMVDTTIQLLVFSTYHFYFFVRSWYALQNNVEKIIDLAMLNWLKILVATIIFYQTLFLIKNIFEDLGWTLSFVRLGTVVLPIYVACIFFLIYHFIKIPLPTILSDLELALREKTIPVVVTNVQREVQFANDAFLAMCGYNFKEIIGKKPSFLQGSLTTPQSVAYVREQLELLQTFEANIVNYRKNGEAYLCQVSIKPYFQNNTLTHFIAYEKEIEVLLGATPNEEEIEILSQIKAYLQEPIVFKNPKLQLSDVAERLDLSPRKISLLINKYDKKSFSDFVNSYRIDAIIKAFQGVDLENKTIETIVLENGFANKSNFYVAFKKVTGETPKAYLQKSNIEHFA